MAENSRGNAVSAYIPAFARGAKIYGANIQSGVITSAHLADLGIVGADVANGAVTSAKIGTGAVVAAKIGAGAVTSAKIGAAAVQAINIAAAAITSAKLKAAFLSGSIVSGGVMYGISHTLGAKPKAVLVAALLTSAQEASATILRLVHAAAVSANTSAKIYIRGNQAANTAMKYQIIAFG